MGLFRSGGEFYLAREPRGGEYRKTVQLARKHSVEAMQKLLFGGIGIGSSQLVACTLGSEHPLDACPRCVALAPPGGDLGDQALALADLAVSISTMFNQLACLGV